MNAYTLTQSILDKRSYLCVGLDTDLEKIPPFLQNQQDAVVLFNKAIIESTLPHCVAYKINTAFYEARGWQGWKELEETLSMIPDTHFKIADAKRGDIGNTAGQYREAFFTRLSFDALTLSPWMGMDTLSIYATLKDKWLIVLGLTSNEGSADFQQKVLKNGKMVYQELIQMLKVQPFFDQTMVVVGATKATTFEDIRKALPQTYFLVPGVGAQGGDLEVISKYGFSKDVGLLVNVSRDILYSSNDENFAQASKEKALMYHKEMELYLEKYLSVKIAL